jgi:hypothetical protein
MIRLDQRSPDPPVRDSVKCSGIADFRFRFLPSGTGSLPKSCPSVHHHLLTSTRVSPERESNDPLETAKLSFYEGVGSIVSESDISGSSETIDSVNPTLQRMRGTETWL